QEVPAPAIAPLEAGAGAEATGATGEPQLDVSLLKAAQEAHETGSTNGHAPQIRAKGLDRDTSAKPLVYSSPELGSDSPNVQTTTESLDGTTSSGSRRQQARSNPNRGSRGNR